MREIPLCRAAVALGIAGILLLLLKAPPCAAEACPMDEQTRMAGCQPLAADCCQTHGEQAASFPLQVLPPALLCSPLGSAVPPAAATALSATLPEEVAPPAIVQGIGLYTFLDVFLI